MRWFRVHKRTSYDGNSNCGCLTEIFNLVSPLCYRLQEVCCAASEEHLTSDVPMCRRGINSDIMGSLFSPMLVKNSCLEQMKMCVAIRTFLVMTVAGQRVLRDGHDVPAGHGWLSGD